MVVAEPLAGGSGNWEQEVVDCFGQVVSRVKIVQDNIHSCTEKRADVLLRAAIVIVWRQDGQSKQVESCCVFRLDCVVWNVLPQHGHGGMATI